MLASVITHRFPPTWVIEEHIDACFTLRSIPGSAKASHTYVRFRGTAEMEVGIAPTEQDANDPWRASPPQVTKAQTKGAPG